MEYHSNMSLIDIVFERNLEVSSGPNFQTCERVRRANRNLRVKYLLLYLMIGNVAITHTYIKSRLFPGGVGRDN